MGCTEGDGGALELVEAEAVEVPDGDAGMGAVTNAGLVLVLLRRRRSAKVSLFSNSSADIVRSSERYDQRCDAQSALV